MNSRGREQEQGFTLIEALISVVILAFGLVGVAQLFAVATSSNAIAGRSTAAAAVGAQEMDRLKAIPFPDTRLNAQGDGDLRTDTDGYSSYVDVPDVGRVLVRWEVVDVTPNLKYIALRSEAGGIFGTLTGAEFTTFRSCTSTDLGCP